MIDVGLGIHTAASTVRLAGDVARMIEKAKSSNDVVTRVITYLQSAQATVQGLALERQSILTQVSECNPANSKQVSAIWSRLNNYLHKDLISPHLESSIGGLRGCREALQSQTTGIRWRKRDKKAAFEGFSQTLSTLEGILHGLESNFYPGGSGMGIQTLVPIFELLTEIRKVRPKANTSRAASFEERLGDLVNEALTDKSQRSWVKDTGEVETIIAQLQLAFSVTSERPRTPVRKKSPAKSA